MILGDYGYDHIPMEQDGDRCEALHIFNRPVIIKQDATCPGVRNQADPEHAGPFTALTRHPERNHALCRRVKKQVGGIRTVARGTPPGDTRDIAGVADEPIHLPVAGAAVVSAVLGYDRQVCPVSTSGFDIAKLRGAPQAPVTDRDLSDVAFQSGSHVVADFETMEMPSRAPSSDQTGGISLRPNQRRSTRCVSSVEGSDESVCHHQQRAKHPLGHVATGSLRRGKHTETGLLPLS